MRISQPGPPGQANAASWRRWLLPAAIGAGFFWPCWPCRAALPRP